MAVVTESAVVGNLCDGVVGVQQGRAGLMDTKSVYEFDWCHAEVGSEYTFKLADREIGDASQVFNINAEFVVVADVLNNAAHLVIGFPCVPQSVQVLSNPSKAEDLTRL